MSHSVASGFREGRLARSEGRVVRAVFARAGHTGAGPDQPGPTGQPARSRSRWVAWLEALGVVLSPAAAALVLRLRLMAPSVLPDPALHTMYIIHPQDVFTRYAAALGPTARLREGARVGFLVPARLDYLAFGAVPGFFVTRYLFALIAVGPVYLLLRRLYGPPAGVVGILVVLSSPVIVTAWGTDYPDCAVVSYVAGAVACLAMPCASRWRRAWLGGAGVLLVLAVWSHGVAVPLVGATLAGYLAVRLVRDRAGLAGDLALLAAVAVAVTGLLVVAAAVLLGHANFIGLTWQALRYLSQPSQTAHWHSANWRWAPYVAYLLVPPAVLGAFAVAVARRGRGVPTPVLLVGVVLAVQMLVYFLLQFVGTVQTLEQHYLSSTLWAGVCLASAITIAELARPLSGRPFARWLPVAVLLVVPLGYEAYPHVPSFGWLPCGGHPGGRRDRRGGGSVRRGQAPSPARCRHGDRTGAGGVRRRRPGAHRRTHPGPPAAAQYPSRVRPGPGLLHRAGRQRDDLHRWLPDRHRSAGVRRPGRLPRRAAPHLAADTGPL